MLKRLEESGLRPFIMLWIGQVVSQFGSAMTSFGISIWLFEETGAATALTSAAAAYFLPNVLLAPIAGTLVDRFDRKRILIVADVMSALSTLVLVLLFAGGSLALWHIIVLNFVIGAFQSVQWPAFSSVITLLVDKKHYGRVSGMQSIGYGFSRILAPIAAAVLYAGIGLRGIFALDFVSFFVAIILLVRVVIPKPLKKIDGGSEKSSFWEEMKYGFTYIFERPSLLGLQSVFLVLNFVLTLGIAVLIPMILARTGNNEAMLGTVQAFGAVGGLVGGLLMTAWGGPKRRVHGVLIGMIVTCLGGIALMGVASGIMIWSAANFMMASTMSITNGSNQAIWQVKIPPEIQGRVFSVRRMIAQVIMPLATFIAGPLADNVFEPAMLEGGALAESFGWLVGNGVGSGMSLMLVLAGSLGVVAPLIAYTVPSIRNVEAILPDQT